MQLVVERDHPSECKSTAISFKDKDIEKYGEELPQDAIDETAEQLTVTIDGRTYKRGIRALRFRCLCCRVYLTLNKSLLYRCSCGNVKLALNTAQTHYKFTKGEHLPGCGQGAGHRAKRLHVDFDKDGVDIDESALLPSKDDIQTIIYDNRPFRRNVASYICPCKSVSLVLNDDKTRIVVQSINNRSHTATCGQKWRKANGLE